MPKPTDTARLTAQQAYRTMLLFLERVYEQTHSEDIAVLLGSVSPMVDAMPADGAMREEWNECVEAVLRAQPGQVAAE